MKRFLLIVTAVLALATYGVAAGNRDEKGSDERWFDGNRNDLRQFDDRPLDHDWYDLRRLDNPWFGGNRDDPGYFDDYWFDRDRNDYRRFNEWRRFNRSHNDLRYFDAGAIA